MRKTTVRFILVGIRGSMEAEPEPPKRSRHVAA